MSGRRHKMDATGSNYEACVNLLLGSVASLVKVPREQDFGIDFYCQPRISEDAHTESVTELAGVQVKGGREQLVYGGLDSRGRWQQHEFTWLRSLAIPLYLARVNQALSTVELFSLWSLWLIFWRQPELPFKVKFVPARKGEMWRGPDARRADVSGRGYGDGKVWTVHLGPPILRLTTDDLKNPTLHSRLVTTFQCWIATDRLTLMRWHQFIPVVKGATEWKTNHPDIKKHQTYYFWNRTPGDNIERLCRTLAPIAVNVGVHLQWQNDSAAYEFIPALEWLQRRGELDEVGIGLLNGLRNAKQMGVGPGSDLPTVEEDD